MRIIQLKQISPFKNKGESLVPRLVLVPTIAENDLFCNLQKSILQEIFFQNKIILFLCKIFFLGASHATYNHIPLRNSILAYSDYKEAVKTSHMTDELKQAKIQELDSQITECKEAIQELRQS